MTGSVEGKVVVVTGAARGMGAAEAAALAQEGAWVIGVDIVDDHQAEDGVATRRLDVTSDAAWTELAQWLRSEYGRIDGLVNNAGVTSRCRLGELALEDWNRIFAVNATGPMLGIQSLMPLMGEGASIVNVCSIAATTGHYPAAYTSSKWALRGLSRAASLELGPLGIRVNTIFPGAVATPMGADIPAPVLHILIDGIPLGRRGAPEDLAGLVVFLMSDQSGFITGAEIAVDGGQSAHGGMKAVSDAMRTAAHEAGTLERHHA